MAKATKTATTTDMATATRQHPWDVLCGVAVAAMSVVGGGSAMATVEEAATAAAGEVEGGQGGWWLCSVFYFSWVASMQFILF
jgi:hypothetical protein